MDYKIVLMRDAEGFCLSKTNFVLGVDKTNIALYNIFTKLTKGGQQYVYRFYKCYEKDY